jgi:membrane AbrB-like protein
METSRGTGMGLLMLLVWAAIGGFLAFRFHIPGGAFIGAMLACVVYRTFSTHGVDLPPALNLSAQVLAGVLVANSFSPQLARTFKPLLPWAVGGAIFYLVVGFTLAKIVTVLGILEPRVAMYSLTPGGLMGMSVISASEGAQAGVVVMFHFIRVILVLMAAPAIAHFILKP